MSECACSLHVCPLCCAASYKPVPGERLQAAQGFPFDLTVTYARPGSECIQAVPARVGADVAAACADKGAMELDRLRRALCIKRADVQQIHREVCGHIYQQARPAPRHPLRLMPALGPEHSCSMPGPGLPALRRASFPAGTGKLPSLQA